MHNDSFKIANKIVGLTLRASPYSDTITPSRRYDQYNSGELEIDEKIDSKDFSNEPSYPISKFRILRCLDSISHAFTHSETSRVLRRAGRDGEISSNFRFFVFSASNSLHLSL